MLPAAALAFLPTGWKQIVQQVVTTVVVGSLCLTLGYCKGESSMDSQWKAKVVLAEAKDLETTVASGEIAGEERVADALRITENEEKLIDAIQSVPDGIPADATVALACQRLRNTGSYSEAALPPSCRREGADRTQARAND